ncbi:MAG: hypothetical protein ACRDG7_09040, partial [Candidatus Limnocylindria bacterium]
MLAWTLGVSAVSATQHGRARVSEARRILIEARDRLRSSAAGTNATLSNLAARTRASAPSAPSKPSKPGDEPDA